jgi:N utilization substance protein B
MKTKADPRHQRRIDMMKHLFSMSFHRDDTSLTNKYPPFNQLKDSIDQLITKCAPEWPLEQINRIDLAILRLALFELKSSTTPHKVVIDEAVELAKEYGSESSSKFVNGVLGTALTKLTPQS